MKSNLQINNEVKILQKENEELKMRLSINTKIIQEFFKTSNINDKISLFVENIKKENNLLLNEINDLKIQNKKLLSINEQISNPNKIKIETYENKLFIYENLLKEKQSIIVNLKEQNKNLNSFINSKINKTELKYNPEQEKEKEQDYKYIIEEIYIISPQQIINTMNDKIELYKDINIKYKNLLQEMKSRLSNKEKEYLKLEEESLNLKHELQKTNQIKNNEEIMNQLIQYQSMKSIPLSHSYTNINSSSLNNPNKNKKNHIRSFSYINSTSHDLNKVMKEIEVYEKVNKTVKEISKNEFDLAGDWAETLKQCGITQEEFVKYCGMKITNKLTSAIEYLYKILIDKNIQIKLLMKENETLNEENIRLNKINIQMETLVDYYEKNNINKNDINNNENKKILNKYNNNSSSKEKRKTYVNVGNNITHTNININMMMDYKKRNNKNKKINNNSYNKLIKEKKNELINKTLNLSFIKKSKERFYKNNDNSFNYNKTIKSIFSNTEKILIKNKGRNTVEKNKNKNNINLVMNSFLTDFKLGSKYKNKKFKNENA